MIYLVISAGLLNLEPHTIRICGDLIAVRLIIINILFKKEEETRAGVSVLLNVLLDWQVLKPIVKTCISVRI